MYIISDVHGCYDTLLALIDKFPKKKKSKICFVGDLVDRGLNSSKVIDFVMENGYDCVLGNHEYMFLKYYPFIKYKINGDSSFSHWFHKCGGKETLSSYSSKKKLNSHIEFLKSLALYKEYKNFKTKDNRHLVVSHSCVGEAWTYRKNDDKIFRKIFEEQVLWSRYKDFDNTDIFNVYGHTILEEVKMKKYSCGIDLGCHKTKKVIPNPRLCALEFPSMKIITQKNIENKST